MKSLLAFIKKEIMEQARSGRLMILGILFFLLGVMNPAVAKLTPWLLEMMADSLSASGLAVTAVSVSALDSWTQFYKNIPMGLIVFLLLESGIFTREYQSGTLLLALTKGLERRKAVIAKAAVLAVLWTACCWLCAGVTWGYSAYFWSDPAPRGLLFSLVCFWVFGLWVVALTVFFSTVAKSNIGVLAGVGGAALASLLLGSFPRLGRYLPTRLTDGTSLIYGLSETGAYALPLLIAGAMAVLLFAASIPIFNRRQL